MDRQKNIETPFRTIIIDPGHGGEDNGAVWGYAEEDDINLAIAFLLRYELQLYRGFSAYLTRHRDIYISLEDRVTLANQMHADFFISIHCDAYHDTTASGISTHVYKQCGEQSKKIATSIQKALIARFPHHKDRGVKQSDFYVLRHISMPAVLVECEFLSNPKTRKFLHKPENQLAIAKAIAHGILIGGTHGA